MPRYIAVPNPIPTLLWAVYDALTRSYSLVPTEEDAIAAAARMEAQDQAHQARMAAEAALRGEESGESEGG